MEQSIGSSRRRGWFRYVPLATVIHLVITCLYQSHWRPDLPMAHILPHWNWPDRVGEVTPVHVFTSGDEAELFLNGESLGRKAKGQYDHSM